MSEPLAGRFDGEGCGCDGSRPCGDDGMPCVAAVFVRCGDCPRNGEETCNYPDDTLRVDSGCYFPEEARHGA